MVVIWFSCWFWWCSASARAEYYQNRTVACCCCCLTAGPHPVGVMWIKFHSFPFLFSLSILCLWFGWFRRGPPTWALCDVTIACSPACKLEGEHVLSSVVVCWKEHMIRLWLIFGRSMLPACATIPLMYSTPHLCHLWINAYEYAWQSGQCIFQLQRVTSFCIIAKTFGLARNILLYLLQMST